MPQPDSFERINRARAALAAEPELLAEREVACGLDEALGDLIDKWCQEGIKAKPYGTAFPLAHYVAGKAYQHGLLLRLAPQPVPEPTNEEIMALMPQQMHEDLAAAVRAMLASTAPKQRGILLATLLNKHCDHAIN